MKMSDMIENRHVNIEPTADELTLRRVRESALRKAGYGKTRMGRRAIALMAASVIALFAFATALATTELGVKLVDALRFAGSGGEYDAMGAYGSAVVCEDTDSDVTVRVDGAYTDDAGSVLALSFHDKKDRINQGIELSPQVFYGTERHNDWDLTIPAKGDDGAWHALLVNQPASFIAGQNIRVEIDSIMPDKTDCFRQELDLTLGEALKMDSPMPVPELDGVAIEGARFEPDGLIISVSNIESYGVSGIDIELAVPMGGILTHNTQGSTIAAPEASSGFLFVDHFGFEKLTAENVDMNAKILISYSRNCEAIPGSWTLSFKMPESAGGMRTVELSETVSTDGRDYRLNAAKLYPSRITVEYTALGYADILSISGEDPESLEWVFGEDNYPLHPRFELELEDQEGQITRYSEYSLLTNEMESEIQFACLTEKYKSITLLVWDVPNKQPLKSITLK